MNNYVNNYELDVNSLLTNIFLLVEQNDDLTPRQVRTIKKIKFSSFFEDNIVFSVDLYEEKLILEKLIQNFFEPVVKEHLNKNISVFIKHNKKISDNESTNFEKSASGILTHFSQKKEENNLIPEFLFNNFIVSSSNQLVYAACLHASEVLDDKSLQVLYIYGRPGLGKTHLLNAIGNNIKKINESKKILYCSGEDFMEDYIKATQEKGNAIFLFKKKYRSLDVLLVDDMQFFSSQFEKTNQEFFHTFNELFSKGKKIIMAADVEPNKLTGLHERVISRIKGVYWSIEKPDYELKEAYIKKYIKTKFPEKEEEFTNQQIRKIASVIQKSIREIQGAIEKIVFYSTIKKESISDDIINDQLKDFIIENTEEITIQKIVKKVAEHFNISEDDIKGSVRSPKFVKARHISMYLTRKFTNLTLVETARFFKKDHSSVINAEKKIKNILTQKEKNFKQIEEITKLIQEK